MERKWKLGIDLGTYDNLLDGFTFDDLILAVRCNNKVVDAAAVMKEAQRILDQRLEDMHFLIENNMMEIIEEAPNS
ncbi:hypothetical protein [Bacteroides acidifaciens]|uniref:hypothetical protein n=1 Tax=Bacteroides acidifaciens TaxID=85831 RepID=UPI00248B1078|nr:hypothetical protein [Bacteroides acidifaciens]